MVDLGTLGGTNSAAQGVSSDGAVVVGFAGTTGNAANRAFRWTGAGMVDLGTLGGTNSAAHGVNADGSVVVGLSEITANAAARAFRWTGAGMVDLGTLGGTNSVALGVNADGAVVVGASQTTGDAANHAFRWTSAGMVDLGTLGGTNSAALGVNADGAVVVGWAGTTATGPFHAFRWTAAGGMADLGSLGDNSANSQANAVSADGSIVVGFSALGSASACTRAFRWTAASGMKDLNGLLAQAGVAMSGITLTLATGVSANGQFIVGDFSGNLRAYLARYDAGAADPGAPPAGPTTPPAGLTTIAAQQQSVDELTGSQFGAMAHQHGLAAPLLGGNTPMGLGSEAGIFASAGSAEAGGFVRYNAGNGFALLGGLAWARENYPSADLRNGFLAAAAVQYVHDNAGWLHPFAEAGGWFAPAASFSFTRTYLNGAGSAGGTGNTRGDLSYYYARAGVLLAQQRTSQLAVSGEIGRERLRLNGYAEELAFNPFNATSSSGADTMDIAKLRLQASHQITERIDGTLWVAGAHGFNRSSDITTTVAGIGALKPAGLNAINWAEYGARLGYTFATAATLDVFVNGVSGRDGIDTRVHAGAAVRVRF